MVDFEMSIALEFWLLAGLVIKHGICDFALQSTWMVAGKGRYGHWGGVCHVAIHGLGSLAVLAFAPAAWSLVLTLIAVELLVHYHIDWAKEQIGRRAGWTPNDQGFWIAIGVDQTLHHLTYLAMIAWLVL